MSYQEKIYIEKNGEKIYGAKLPVIINNNGYYLGDITVFQDGLIDCWGLKDLNQIRDEIKCGRIMQNIPNNVELECDLGMIKVSEFIPEKSNEDFIKEIEDLINDLNNRSTKRSICENAFKTYLIDPSESNRISLKEKYDDLPSHQKVLFEYIEEKDPLCLLMNEGKVYDLEKRKYYLKLYFKFE